MAAGEILQQKQRYYTMTSIPIGGGAILMAVGIVLIGA